jgi:uncharacterized membrane-anchored protein
LYRGKYATPGCSRITCRYDPHYFDRTLGLGYVKSSAALLCVVVVVVAVWHFSTGAIAVDRVTSRKDEIFYW